MYFCTKLNMHITEHSVVFISKFINEPSVVCNTEHSAVCNTEHSVLCNTEPSFVSITVQCTQCTVSY